MVKRCAEVENVVKRRRLDLLIAQAQLLQREATSNAQISDLRKALAVEQFRASITQEKVRAILKRHKINTLNMVKDLWIRVGKLGRLEQLNFYCYVSIDKIGKLKSKVFLK